MTDYQSQLEFFSEQERRAESEEFFAKYWLDQSEYSNRWHQIQNAVFNPIASGLSDGIFDQNFILLPTAIGTIFSSYEEFKKLQDCMLALGDTAFAVVQNPNHTHQSYLDNHWETEPLLRFRFPSDIVWDELMSGGLISYELFETCRKDYYVFGDSGKWGRYVSPEFVSSPTGSFPVEVTLTGFRREHAKLFVTALGTLVGSEIAKYLPVEYLDRIIEDFTDPPVPPGGLG